MSPTAGSIVPEKHSLWTKVHPNYALLSSGMYINLLYKYVLYINFVHEDT